jgi:hypothetical protein
MILNVCHVLNQVSANKKNNSIRGVGEEKVKTLLPMDLGCLAKVNVPIHKKRKLREKTWIVFFWTMFFIIGIQILDSKI